LLGSPRDAHGTPIATPRFMGHPLRWFHPGGVYETTIRTIQERFLLRPGPAARDIVLGVLGRAQWLYPGIRLYAFAYLSNHAHLLVSGDDARELAAFLGFVNGNVAREMGRLHDWRGPLWGRRYRPIPILDDDALVARLRYVVAQGVKEGLVASPTEWPGATAVPGLLGRMELRGTWYDRNLETRARRRGRAPAREEFAREYIVRLTAIPPWAHLPPDQLQQRHAELARDVEASHRRGGAAVLGRDVVQAEDPHDRPASSKRRPAPLCHATRAALRERFRAALRVFVSAFRAAAAALRVGAPPSARDAAFPPGSFPPRLPHVASPPGPPPWLARARASPC